MWSPPNQHLCYNRIPLLANIVHDRNYEGSGVLAQHVYPMKAMESNDKVFVKTDFLGLFLEHYPIQVPITLITGVSDLSPTEAQANAILTNPLITRWIGHNIDVSHPKITKILIGVGEPERPNGNHDMLVQLHSERVKWEDKKDDVCVPYHSKTHQSRHLEATLPKLDFPQYMNEISKSRFVVCMRGNGIDTHRFCEVLLMGSVPIVLHSGLDDLYSTFPCVILDSFDAIDIHTFVWDDAKYEAFVDAFWLRNSYKDALQC